MTSIFSICQVWNWFQNRRYALRAKASKAPEHGQASVPRDDQSVTKNVPQAPQTQPTVSSKAESISYFTFIYLNFVFNVLNFDANKFWNGFVFLPFYGVTLY